MIVTVACVKFLPNFNLFFHRQVALMTASTIPYAFIGGFISLWVTGTVFGISAGIGFIILFGITAINSILLIAKMKENRRKYGNLRIAIDEAVRERIRPILMVALMGSMGLLPAALPSGMGSEIQKPLAIIIFTKNGQTIGAKIMDIANADKYVDVSNLQEGIYIVQLQTNGITTYGSKLIINR